MELSKLLKGMSLQAILILVLGFLAHQFLPWWITAVVCGLVAIFLKVNSAASFAAGFAAGTLLWSGYAGILNNLNAGSLADQVGQIFQGLKGMTLVYLTGLMGGVLGGLGSLIGSLARGIFSKNN